MILQTTASSMSIGSFVDSLWKDYVQMTPQANAISNALIMDHGEVVQHDHVAFRTFNLEPIRIENLEPIFFDLGYERHDQPYHFPAKHLDAFGYLPPSETDLPRIFLSELRVEELSKQSQSIIHDLVNDINDDIQLDPSTFWAGPLWKLPSYEDYAVLQKESEYAAWLSIIGLRPNHFALHVNSLSSIHEIEEMNALVESLGFQVNESGGRVKGTPEVLLEQGSTMASVLPVEFRGGDIHDIPTCYYEYAKRHVDKDGNLYQGFVTASADKIFESTDRRGDEPTGEL